MVTSWFGLGHRTPLGLTHFRNVQATEQLITILVCFRIEFSKKPLLRGRAGDRKLVIHIIEARG